MTLTGSPTYLPSPLRPSWESASWNAISMAVLISDAKWHKSAQCAFNSNTAAPSRIPPCRSTRLHWNVSNASPHGWLAVNLAQSALPIFSETSQTGVMTTDLPSFTKSKRAFGHTSQWRRHQENKPGSARRTPPPETLCQSWFITILAFHCVQNHSWMELFTCNNCRGQDHHPL